MTIQTRSARLAPGVAVALALAACGGDAPADRGARIERDTVGDTVIVRTLEGSEWGGLARLEPELRIGVFEGEDHFMFGQVRSIAVAPDGAIYAMDTQVPALRKYAADGSYVTTFGREGGGPGEYESPDGGLTVLDDGRVVLRDPGNARLQVYSPGGEPLATWPIRGGFNTSSPLQVDTAGRLYTQVLLDPEAHVSDWRMGLVAYDTETGEAVDTVAAPTWDYEEPRIMAQRTTEGGTSVSMNSVPFSPSSSWAFSPLGHMVGALSTRYAIDQHLPGGRVLRVERVYDPVPVTSGERANREEQARWNMRRTQPDWTWNGPAIPDTKPPFRGVFTGRDGRLWVLLHAPGEEIPAGEIVEEDDPQARPPTRWREPILFDVFEADGTYLGQAAAPDGFSTSPTPIFDGDRVWAVVRDELDVQYITRFRVSRAEPRSTE